MDDDYPKSIADNWPGVWSEDIDAVLYQGGSKAYFFKGDDYLRYDLETDSVDQSGQITNLVLDPVPSGMWTAARDLSLAQANTVMGYLIQKGKLTLNSSQTPYKGDWLAGIVSPLSSVRVVVKPAKIDKVEFINDLGAATLIDNLDQRMLVALYRLTRWVNASANIEVITHKGIGHGNGPPTDCHNQGRALDFSGLKGAYLGVAFSRNVKEDWGNRVENIPGITIHLDPVVDRISHDLFRIVFRFGTFECECNGIGQTNKWPPKEIGDSSGFVIHPDYIPSSPDEEKLPKQHRDHIHMQIGPT